MMSQAPGDKLEEMLQKLFVPVLKVAVPWKELGILDEKEKNEVIIKEIIGKSHAEYQLYAVTKSPETKVATTMKPEHVPQQGGHPAAGGQNQVGAGAAHPVGNGYHEAALKKHLTVDRTPKAAIVQLVNQIEKCYKM
jgi:hypothetical protein